MEMAAERAHWPLHSFRCAMHRAYNLGAGSSARRGWECCPRGRGRNWECGRWSFSRRTSLRRCRRPWFRRRLGWMRFSLCAFCMAADAIWTLRHMGHRDSNEFLGFRWQFALSKDLTAERAKCCQSLGSKLFALLCNVARCRRKDGLFHDSDPLFR